jgi:hypothetical protein
MSLIASARAFETFEVGRLCLVQFDVPKAGDRLSADFNPVHQ